MPLKNKTIFIFGYMRFDGLASTNFTIAKYLSQSNDVYYIDHPYTWKDYFLSDKTSEAYAKRKAFFFDRKASVLNTGHERLKVVITPPVLPINWLPEGRLYRLLLKANEKVILKAIKRLIKAKGISEYIYINSFNFHYPGLLKHLKPILSIYHCVDPLIIPYDKRHGLVSEQKILEESQIVICTSKALYEEKRLANPNTYFVPNGAEVANSASVLAGSYPIHKALLQINHPIVGYLGAIERRMDFDLLDQVIKNNPNLNFVFIGPATNTLLPAWFTSTPNVFLLPPVQHHEINEVLVGFDICIIPFKVDAVSKTIFPLKLFEYLGMGKPVVATCFNLDLETFTGNSVDYAPNPETFSQAINAKLVSSVEQVRERIAVAAQNTWAERVKHIEEIIANHLPPT